MGRGAKERGEKRRERKVEMKMKRHGVSAVEHRTAVEARKKREIVTRKDERMNPKQYCLWIEDDDGVYQTSCLHSFEFLFGTPEHNGVKFCPYCGKPIGRQTSHTPQYDGYRQAGE